MSNESTVADKEVNLGKLEEFMSRNIKDSTIVVTSAHAHERGTPSETLRVQGKILMKDALDFAFTATLPPIRVAKKLLEQSK